jgi:hypothetical protein
MCATLTYYRMQTNSLSIANGVVPDDVINLFTFSASIIAFTPLTALHSVTTMHGDPGAC